MTKAERAVGLFQQGYNCAQAVLCAFCGDLDVTCETALKTAHGFGGGMGRLQEVCGAATGAFMALGLKYGSADASDTESKERLYGLVRAFSDRFQERNRTLVCRELLNCDLLNDDKSVTAPKVKTVCPRAIKDAAEILEELIER